MTVIPLLMRAYMHMGPEGDRKEIVGCTHAHQLLPVPWHRSDGHPVSYIEVEAAGLRSKSLGLCKACFGLGTSTGFSVSYFPPHANTLLRLNLLRAWTGRPALHLTKLPMSSRNCPRLTSKCNLDIPRAKLRSYAAMQGIEIRWEPQQREQNRDSTESLFSCDDFMDSFSMRRGLEAWSLNGLSSFISEKCLIPVFQYVG